MRTAIYCRISQDRGGAGLGVTRQEADCRALIERLGWHVTDVLVDNDLSAYTGRRRPGYEQLLDLMKGGHVDAVAVWHPDRLVRRPAELESLIDLVDATGVQIATVQAGDYDLTTATGRMIARIVGSVSRFEGEHKSERQRRKNLEVAEAGRPHGGGMRAYGYSADGHLVLEEEAGVVREIARAVLAGESVTGIVKQLNAAGIPTARGGAWTVTTIRSMLTNPRLAGLRQYHGRTYDAVWPAIFERDTWQAVRAVVTSKATGTRRPRRHVLTGLVFCGRCGRRLEGTVRNGRPEYRCKDNAEGSCGLRAVAGPLEQHVVASALASLDVEGLAGAAAQLPAPDHDGDAIALQLRLEELAQSYALGTITRPEWEAARTTVAKRLEELQTAIARSATDAGVTALLAHPDGIAAAWEGASLAQRRRILDAIIERVEVGPALVRGSNRFDPRRVTITYRA